MKSRSAPDARDAHALEIKFDLMIRARPETVWRVITDPSLIPLWNYMSRVDLDRLAPGGTFIFYSESPQSAPDRGVIAVVEPGRRLAYDWHSNEPAPTRVEYELVPEGEYTRLKFRNSGFLEGGDWSDFYAQDYRGWVKYHLEMKTQAEGMPAAAAAR